MEHIKDISSPIEFNKTEYEGNIALLHRVAVKINNIIRLYNSLESVTIPIDNSFLSNLSFDFIRSHYLKSAKVQILNSGIGITSVVDKLVIEAEGDLKDIKAAFTELERVFVSDSHTWSADMFDIVDGYAVVSEKTKNIIRCYHSRFLESDQELEIYNDLLEFVEGFKKSREKMNDKGAELLRFITTSGKVLLTDENKNITPLLSYFSYLRNMKKNQNLSLENPVL